MRKLTKKEQHLVKVLVEKYQPGHDLTIGILLSKLYNIISIRKYIPTEKELIFQSKEELSRIIIQYENNPYGNFSVDFYEALLFICYLVEQHYLIVHPLYYYDDMIIGDRMTLASILNPKISSYGVIEESFYDIFPLKLWPLMNSTFIVTNALIDFSKDFKTEEQRRFEKQLEDNDIKHKEAIKKAQRSLLFSQLSFMIAILSVIITILLSRCSTTKLDNEQFEVLKQSISILVNV